jgi:hypothetical protein
MSFLLGLPIVLLVLLAVVALLIHFLPAFLAYRRRAEHFWWIFAINFFFGWTFIGWIIALVWALQDRPRYMVGYGPPPPYNP